MTIQELFQGLIQKHGVRVLAAELGISPDALYKWAEQGGSHREGPLEKTLPLLDSVAGREVLEWLCRRQGGTFVPDAAPVPGRKQNLLATTSGIEEVLATVIATVAQASSDGKLSQSEVRRIMKWWGKTKSAMETFLNRAKLGIFGDRD